MSIGLANLLTLMFLVADPGHFSALLGLIQCPSAASVMPTQSRNGLAPTCVEAKRLELGAIDPAPVGLGPLWFPINTKWGGRWSWHWRPSQGAHEEGARTLLHVSTQLYPRGNRATRTTAGLTFP